MKREIYFKRATKEEMKVAKEILSIMLEHFSEIQLDMPSFVSAYYPDASFCNTSCCLLGFHKLVYNNDPANRRCFSDYLRYLGISEDSYFTSFCLDACWPADDKLHAKKRIEFVVNTGYVPCLGFANIDFPEFEFCNINDLSLHYLSNPSTGEMDLLTEATQDGFDAIYTLEIDFEYAESETVNGIEYKKTYLTL